MFTCPDWILMEHRVAEILTQQEIHGWHFDEAAAWELTSSLYSEFQGISNVLRNRYPFVKGQEFTPKRPNRTLGYVAGATLTKTKEFNPTSREHIAFVMQWHHGWKPSKLTATGKAQIDEVVLKDLGTPEALQFLRLLEIRKQLGMLSEGNNAWLKLVRDGRIHHRCSVATSTHRCAHRNPNLAQVPSDERFRALFTATPGLAMVGADLSGIELRMLAHYLARYDGGRYGDVLLNGDIHQENADKIGISRRLVKTVTYAFLYGAGDQKIGLSYDSQLKPSAAAKKGAEIRQAYMDAIPGLEALVRDVKQRGKGGFIKAIDGRKVPVDAPHKALNYLLQSSAGIIAKRWMILANESITSTSNVHQLAFIHDELQFECPPEGAKDLAFNLEFSAAVAGEFYKLRVPIAAEAKIGKTWADVH